MDLREREQNSDYETVQLNIKDCQGEVLSSGNASGSRGIGNRWGLPGRLDSTGMQLLGPRPWLHGSAHSGPPFLSALK